MNRFKKSALSKGLIQENYGNKEITYLFSSKNKRGRSIYITKNIDSTQVYIDNINDGCSNFPSSYEEYIEEAKNNYHYKINIQVRG